MTHIYMNRTHIYMNTHIHARIIFWYFNLNKVVGLN
jgi:hypothetical protein